MPPETDASRVDADRTFSSTPSHEMERRVSEMRPALQNFFREYQTDRPGRCSWRPRRSGRRGSSTTRAETLVSRPLFSQLSSRP